MRYLTKTDTDTIFLIKLIFKKHNNSEITVLYKLYKRKILSFLYNKDYKPENIYHTICLIKEKKADG